MAISAIKFLPPVIAHRGASAYAPENTISAFVKAIQQGATWIECDVMTSADGCPIIFHDEVLDRTTNGCGEIDQCVLQELRALDAGMWFAPQFSGERIPTLEQVMSLIDTVKISANIELKAKPNKEQFLVKSVLREWQRLPLRSQTHFLFSSFSIPTLEYLRDASSDCLIGLLMEEWRADWQVICDALQCVSVHLPKHLVTKERVKQIKHTGRFLLAYTVNDPEQALAFYSYGVDAVFSDYPDKILNVSSLLYNSRTLISHRS